MIFDRFFKKKAEEAEIPKPEPLPADLEKFRFSRYAEQRLPQQTQPTQPLPERSVEKIDLVLQKLETIEARLRIIEERLGR